MKEPGCHPERNEAKPIEVEGPCIAPHADPDDEDPPRWVQQASLSETLLWRLGIPLDRERMELQYARSKEIVDLKPPITAAKVADAIAHLSLQLMRGEIDPATAKTTLYALQTLLTALRLQLVQDKQPKGTKKKSRKPARRRKQIAKLKR